MNWYKLLKFAQIWDVETEGTFADNLRRVYELEYKYNALNNYDFTGMPQRRENILGKLETELEDALDKVEEPIKETFKSWLSEHALLDPEQWAIARTDQIYEYGDAHQAFMNMLYEYMHYTGRGHGSQDETFVRLINEAAGDAGRFPSFNRYFDIYAAEYKENMLNELGNVGLEEFGRIYGQEFVNEEEAIEFVENYFNRDFIADNLSQYDIETVVGGFENVGLDYDIIVEFFANVTFPVWYLYWKQQGIDKTRRAVETIFNMLENAQTPGERIAAIFQALNAVHQTGPMIDKIEEHLGEDATEIIETMDELSGGTSVPKWNKELRTVGVKVPRVKKQPVLV